MSKKESFVKFIDTLIADQDMPADAAEYWEAFKQIEEKEKPQFTENGRLVLKFLQDHPEPSLWKAKDIAEQLGISSRVVSGAMRKICDDGYVEKMGKDPTIYKITDNGKNATII